MLKTAAVRKANRPLHNLFIWHHQLTWVCSCSWGTCLSFKLMLNKSSSIWIYLSFLGNSTVKNGTCVLITIRLYIKYGEREILALLNWSSWVCLCGWALGMPLARSLRDTNTSKWRTCFPFPIDSFFSFSQAQWCLHSALCFHFFS